MNCNCQNINLEMGQEIILPPLPPVPVSPTCNYTSNYFPYDYYCVYPNAANLKTNVTFSGPDKIKVNTQSINNNGSKKPMLIYALIGALAGAASSIAVYKYLQSRENEPPVKRYIPPHFHKMYADPNTYYWPDMNAANCAPAPVCSYKSFI